MNNMTVLISLMAGVAVGAVFYGVYSRLHARSALAERLKGGTAAPVALEEADLSEGFARRVLIPWLRHWLARLGRLTPAGNIERVQHDLLLAGQPGGMNVLDLMGIKLVLALAVGTGLFAVLKWRQMSTLPALLFALAGAMVALYLPNLWLRGKKGTRQRAIRRALPDALDMLSICNDAGLGFEAALMKVASRWENDLTEQFSRVVKEVRMGVRRPDALRRMVERTEVPEVASFVAVLVQADRLGVGITNVLHTQSDDARRRRRQHAEQEARKAPIKMLVPLVFCIFPAMFVVILGPAVPRFMAFFGMMNLNF